MRREFLAELFVEAGDPRVRSELVRRAREAAEQSGDARVVRAIFIPEDEMCFLVIEADSAAVIARLAQHASLPIDRIVAAETKGVTP